MKLCKDYMFFFYKVEYVIGFIYLLVDFNSGLKSAYYCRFFNSIKTVSVGRHCYADNMMFILFLSTNDNHRRISQCDIRKFFFIVVTKTFDFFEGPMLRCQRVYAGCFHVRQKLQRT